MKFTVQKVSVLGPEPEEVEADRFVVESGMVLFYTGKGGQGASEQVAVFAPGYWSSVIKAPE